MRTIVVKTQADIDTLPAAFSEFTTIEIRSDIWIEVNRARENSNVVARENSKVEAWGNSKVVARGNSNVEARGNSNVEARGCVSVHVHSELSVTLLFGFAVAFALVKATITKKAETATIITPKRKTGNSGWLEDNAVASESGSVILFKRVSSQFKTQEGTPMETLWEIGKTLTHPNWEPKSEECNGGKFHACSRPYFCDEFRDTTGDVYVAIKIAVKDLYAWPKSPQYPHKIAFRKGKVLYQCDKWGEKINA